MLIRSKYSNRAVSCLSSKYSNRTFKSSLLNVPLPQVLYAMVTRPLLLWRSTNARLLWPLTLTLIYLLVFYAVLSLSIMLLSLPLIKFSLCTFCKNCMWICCMLSWNSTRMACYFKAHKKSFLKCTFFWCWVFFFQTMFVLTMLWTTRHRASSYQKQ